MKLNAITFARLIARITLITNWRFNKVDLEDIYDIIEFEVPEPQPNKADCEKVNGLLFAMNDKSSIIPAIKVYRELTGVGLKEAKDAIERFI